MKQTRHHNVSNFEPLGEGHIQLLKRACCENLVHDAVAPVIDSDELLALLLELGRLREICTPLSELTKSPDSSVLIRGGMIERSSPACLTEGCKATSYCRGLCVSCYRQASETINKTPDVDADMVTRGQILPVARGWHDQHDPCFDIVVTHARTGLKPKVFTGTSLSHALATARDAILGRPAA